MIKSLFSFLFLSLSGLLLIGCASSEDEASGPVSYPNPSTLDTQARIQDMHSDALRQEF